MKFLGNIILKYTTKLYDNNLNRNLFVVTDSLWELCVRVYLNVSEFFDTIYSTLLCVYFFKVRQQQKKKLWPIQLLLLMLVHP